MVKRNRPGKEERAEAKAKHSEGAKVKSKSTSTPVPYDTAGALGGDASRRAATHHIPKEDRHPSVTGASLNPLSRDYVPVNETPPPHVLDPEGHVKRTTERQQEARKAAHKRNEAIAKEEGKEYSPRPARTARDRAIQSGGGIPYDNSQAGDFRDSSQKHGKMPEERYKNAGKGESHPPVTPGGRTSQQADTPPGGTLPSGNASAPEEVEGEGVIEEKKGNKKLGQRRSKPSR